MNKNDGGLVYPSEQGHIPDASWNQTYEAGITRRDWLAGLAMQGMMANSLFLAELKKTANQLKQEEGVFTAKTAYELADCMIAEGNK